MRYIEPVYRPPSEAYSLIIQLTIGCSQNGCHFCDMYKSKKFYVRVLEDVLEDFSEARKYYKHVEHIFLADGDALVCPTDFLVTVLDFIHENFPECTRVTSYASPRSIITKTDDELSLIHQRGLEMLFLGLESGCDEVLKLMNKQATSQEIVNATIRAKNAGFKMSVTIIAGLGGKALSEKHAADTAVALSAMKPEFIGMLTLNVSPETVLAKKIERGEFELLHPNDILRENRILIAGLDCEGAIFRANHITNYVNIRGTLNVDKEKMLSQIDYALENYDLTPRTLYQI